MSKETFKAPVTVKLDGNITWNEEHGFFQMAVVDGGDLKAVRIGQGDLKLFLNTDSNHETKQIELLRADMERFGKLVSTAATFGWPEDSRIIPVFEGEQ
jgi:hypothetical protein